VLPSCAAPKKLWMDATARASRRRLQSSSVIVPFITALCRAEKTKAQALNDHYVVRVPWL
jgi:hypothetical protein